MFAIKLVNQVLSSTAPTGEFHILQGEHVIARIGVHAGGSASIPTTNGHSGTPNGSIPVFDENNDGNVNTAQQWVVYAIVNGITTSTVRVTDPNATVTLAADNLEGFSLSVS